MEQQVKPTATPKGFVLGSQPGAGKSALGKRLFCKGLAL